MKPELNTIRSVSTLAGETQRMTLDENALDHLMSVMTDLYADPMLAVIREYSTNAFDATVDAGSTEPIRVTLPTTTKPNFVVQDFGIGMTTDDVLHVYSQYGNSTKRDSDDVVGMLGLGCKSGLTYASSFVIRTVRNGVETVANVTKNSEAIGEIQIIDTKKSNERNGTTITVPVSRNDISFFAQKALEFYYYWQPGTVIVEGRQIDFFVNSNDSYIQTQDGSTYYSKASGYNPKTIVVMGNVPYPVSPREWTSPVGGHSGHSIVHFAPIGAVNFAPSREELSYRGKTKQYLSDTLPAILNAEIQYLITSKMDEANSYTEAFDLASELRRLSFISNTTITWNRETVPTMVPGIFDQGAQGDDTYYWNTKQNWNGKNQQISRNPWFSNGATFGAIIYNAPNNLSAAHKYGLRERFGSAELLFLMGDEISQNKWITAFDWNVLRKELVKPAKAPKVAQDLDRTGRNFAILDKYGEYTGEYVADMPDDTIYFAFTPSNRPDKHYFGRYASAGMKMVSVYKADFDDFAKKPNVVTSAKDAEARFQKRIDSLTNEDWNVYYLASYYGNQAIEALSECLDKSLSSMVESKMTAGEVEALVNELPYNLTWKHRNDAGVRVSKALEKRYPLFARGDKATLLTYLNAIYTYTTKEN